MEPVSMIVAALAAGAAAAAQDLGGQALKDAYGALKNLISERYRRAGAVAALEEDPSSEQQRKALEETLTKARAEGDAELLRTADALSTAMARIPKSKLQGVAGFRIHELEAVNAVFERIRAHDFDIGKLKLKGDFVARDLDLHDPN
jgi:hypothetical protein